MKVTAFGSNSASQLAQNLETTYSSHVPLVLDFNEKIDKICCGTLHTLILSKNTIYSFGCNDESALGRIGSETDILPIDFKKNEKIIQISAGSSHSALLTKKGSVYAWGTFRGRSGVLGFSEGVRIQRAPKFLRKNVVFICSAYNCLVMVTTAGDILEYGDVLWRPKVSIQSVLKVDLNAISGPGVYQEILDQEPVKDSRLANQEDQVNTTSISRKKKEESVKDKRSVNQVNAIPCGQMSTNNEIVKDIPSINQENGQNQMTENIVLIEDTNPENKITNPNTNLTNTKKGSIFGFRKISTKFGRSVKQIRAGGNHILILNKKGKVFAYGNNFCGQLGNGTQESIEFPNEIQFDEEIIKVAGGTTHTLFLTKSHKLFGVGQNSCGQLGISLNECLKPVHIMDDVLDIESCGMLSVVYKKEGLFTAGSNFDGEAGHDNEKIDLVKVFTRVDYDFGDIKMYSCGDNHTVVISN